MKSDVTSGLNGALQLVSQSEKMGFRFGKIFFYLQTIRLVSFQTEGRKMLQVHFFDFESKTLGQWQQLVMFWRKITESLLSSDFTPGGVLPETLGGGVRLASQNPCPIYDQDLRYSLPYLWPDQKFETLFMTWLLNQNPVSDQRYNKFPSSNQC